MMQKVCIFGERKKESMRVLDLFAGIGGFSLAAHWMGWKTAAFVEWDEFCQKVLKKNFQGVPVFGDINGFGYAVYKSWMRKNMPNDKDRTVDIICGGPPCQPVSSAGKRKGKNDHHWGWPPMFRIVREFKPALVVIENVAGLISMDGGALLEEIFTDLESEGYAVQPFVIPAISVGAPHRRDRVWIVASHTNSGRMQEPELQQPDIFAKPDRNTANAQRERLEGAEWIQGATLPAERNREDSWHSAKSGLERCGQPGECPRERVSGSPDWQTHWYEAALATCNVRMDDGLSDELDFIGARDNRNARLKALGNAIVPQVAYEIFRAINEVNTQPC